MRSKQKPRNHAGLRALELMNDILRGMWRSTDGGPMESGNGMKDSIEFELNKKRILFNGGSE